MIELVLAGLLLATGTTSDALAVQSAQEAVEAPSMVEAEEIPAEEVNTAETAPETAYYGACRITFYCSCSQCCGQWAGGATASGAMPTPNHTVANGSLPFGTKVIIDGQEYVVEDRGVDGDQFDIFVSDHQEALERGLYYADVYLVN